MDTSAVSGGAVAGPGRAGPRETGLPRACERTRRHRLPRPLRVVLLPAVYFLVVGRTEIVTDDGYCRE